MLIRRNTNISKAIKEAFKSMLNDFHLTLTQKPSDITIIEWYIATHNEDKDVNYFYEKCKNLHQYTTVY
jgi:hypothetical protein